MYYVQLSCPYSFNRFSQSNVIGLELIESNSYYECRSSKTPMEYLADSGYTLLGKIINDKGPIGDQKLVGNGMYRNLMKYNLTYSKPICE